MSFTRWVEVRAKSQGVASVALPDKFVTAGLGVRPAGTLRHCQPGNQVPDVFNPVLASALSNTRSQSPVNYVIGLRRLRQRQQRA
jgi:hypothetical protein